MPVETQEKQDALSNHQAQTVQSPQNSHYLVNDIESYLYRLQLAFVYVYVVRGSLIIRGTDSKETLERIKYNEDALIRYIKEAVSQYWIMYTIDNSFLPLRFREPVDFKTATAISHKIISAMPCGYEAGLFDIEAGEVFG